MYFSVNELEFYKTNLTRETALIKYVIYSALIKYVNYYLHSKYCICCSAEIFLYNAKGTFNLSLEVRI